MLERFYPAHEAESAYDINYDELYQKGYRGLIYDIDNTLTEHGAPATKQAKDLMEQLKRKGFQICLLSNNKEERVKMFNKEIKVNYIYKAGKPSVKGYQRAMGLMGTTRENTVFIADQLFTDVYGANRAGIVSCLVKPIAKHEEIQIVLKRYIEKIVLYFYHKKQRKKGSKF